VEHRPRHAEAERSKRVCKTLRQTHARRCAVPEFEKFPDTVSAIGPTITATLSDGPLKGKSTEAEVVEGRPPKTIDIPVEDGSTYRYCLEGWVQSGRSAVYTFLYRV
jgi:hypothetical protein